MQKGQTTVPASTPTLIELATFSAISDTEKTKPACCL